MEITLCIDGIFMQIFVLLSFELLLLAFAFALAFELPPHIDNVNKNEILICKVSSVMVRQKPCITQLYYWNMIIGVDR